MSGRCRIVLSNTYPIRIRHRYGLDTYHSSILFLFNLGNIEYMPLGYGATQQALPYLPGLFWNAGLKNIGIEKKCKNSIGLQPETYD